MVHLRRRSFYRAWARLTNAALLVALMATAPAHASAQPEADARQRAYELFDESRARYRAGEFEQAVSLLREAYTIHEEPVLLYNLARALEGLGRWTQAIDAYERFLEAQPDARDRGAIEQRLETLRRAAADAAREAPAPLPDRDLPVAASGPTAGPFVVMGLGAAGLLTGAVLGALAIERRDAAANEPAHATAAQALWDAESLALATNVTLLVAGVVAAAGLTWGIVEWSSGEEHGDESGDAGGAHATLALRVAPLGLALRGRFALGL